MGSGTGLARRSVLTGAAGGLGLAALAGAARAQYWYSGVTPVVKTTNGPVMGVVEEGVQTFKGLRYGAPPVGPLRWEPPQKPKPWTDTAFAVRFGPAAIQMTGGGAAVRYPGLTGIGLGQIMTAAEDVVRQSEDCLFINVWTPALDNKARAVMVWFHGGGYAYGSGSWPTYDGHNLAKNHDVVVVTVNHRLNVFGYLHLAALGGHATSGNAGQLDLVAVLEWVRDNIAAFGGDPSRVTCFGQSGGGGKTSTMMAVPAAKGLFKGAIIESGASIRAGDADRATEGARALMKALGVSDIAALKQVPYDKILTTLRDPQAMGGRGGAGFGPVLDGVSIPAHPFDPLANPLARDVAVMVGCTTDEQVMYNIGADWWGKLSEAELAQRLKPQYGDKTDAVIAAAKKRYPKDDPSYLFTDIASKGAFFGSTTLAERKAAQPAGVYAYLWEWGAPVDGGVLRAPHTMELPFVFDNVHLGPILLGKAPATFALGKQASTAWTSFAKTGNPNAAGSGLPTWPRFDPKSRPVMVFNTKSRIEMDPYAEFKALQPARGGPGPA